MDKVKIIKLPVKRWREYKELKVKGIKEFPNAFCSTWEKERGEETDEKYRRHIEQAFESKDSTMLFAEQKGKLVGTITALFYPGLYEKHVATIVGVVVDKEYQGQGIGRTLFERMFSLLRKRGVIKVNLHVETSVEGSLAFYKKMGFRKVGKLEKETYVNGRYHDAYLMEKIL